MGSFFKNVSLVEIIKAIFTFLWERRREMTDEIDRMWLNMYTRTGMLKTRRHIISTN
jgi:hypothetical protein